jgi:hypothetical protein
MSAPSQAWRCWQGQKVFLRHLFAEQQRQKAEEERLVAEAEGGKKKKKKKKKRHSRKKKRRRSKSPSTPGTTSPAVSEVVCIVFLFSFFCVKPQHCFFAPRL